MYAPKELILAIGTNIDQEMNMFVAKQLISQLFHHVVFTSEIWTNPVNIHSDSFLNCLAYTQTTHGLKQIKQAIRQIEHKCGVSQAMKHAGYVKLDIDILFFDGTRYHEEDWERHYVQHLIKELTDRNITHSITPEITPY